jgi:hypothetical protein
LVVYEVPYNSPRAERDLGGLVGLFMSGDEGVDDLANDGHKLHQGVESIGAGLGRRCDHRMSVGIVKELKHGVVVGDLGQQIRDDGVVFREQVHLCRVREHEDVIKGDYLAKAKKNEDFFREGGNEVVGGFLG